MPVDLPRRDQVERLVRLLERELGADDRVERAAPPEREQLVHLLLDELRLEAHQPTEVEALDADVPADEPRRVDLLPGAAGEADPDRDAERAQRLDARREDLAADRIEGDVDVVELADLLVAHRPLCAELPRELELLRRPGRGRDVGAAERRHLDRSRADAACGRRHEHVRVGMDPGLAGHRDPGGQVRGQERGALGVARARRQVEHPLVLDGDALGVAAAGVPHEREHASAVDVAGDLVAEDRRQLRRLRVHAVLDQHVGEVDPGRAHLEQGLSLGHVRFGHVLHGQRRARLAEDGRPHRR